MIINFALSLSVEGIELLHRVQGGWRRLGRTKIDSSTLEADLIELRQKAIALAPDGLATKLIIPRDQIKYTAIDTTQTTQDDVFAVLEGATPYALDDLVIDSERFGGRTHIAAVPRETLKEAEAFAAAHGFRPVAFVGVPEPFTFQSEVFFGPTAAMTAILGAGATVTRDDLPVMIVGTRIKSRLLVMDESKLFQDADTLADLMAQGLPEPEYDTVQEPAEQAVPEVVEVVEVAKEISLYVAPDNWVAEEIAAPVAPEDTQITDVENTVIAPVEQRMWIDKVPPEHNLPAPEPIVDEPQVSVVPADPVFAALIMFDKIIPEHHATATPVARPKPALVATSRTNAAIAAPAAPRRAAAAAPVKRINPLLIAAGVAALAVALGGVFWSQRPAQDVAGAQTATAPIAVTTSLPAPALPVLEDGPVIPSLEITGFAATPETTPPEIAATLQTPVVASRPDALVALPADPLPLEVQAPPAPPVDPQIVTEQAPARTVLSPDEAEQSYAATGVWQRAPRLLDEPSGAISFGFEEPALTTAPARTATPEPPLSVATAREVPFVAPADPPAPGVVFDRDADGFILATPEGTLTPEGALVFAGLPDLAITPRPTLSAEDLDRMALLAPAPEGVIVVAGRPDFATPLRPADLPVPETPQVVTEDAAPAVATAGSVGLASLELQNSGALALDTTVIENRAADDLRPQLRPSGLVASVENSSPDITDILSEIASEDATLRFVTSTALAVPRSVRPQDRPSEFADLVAAAQSRQVTNQIEAVAAAIAPVTPAAPVAPQNTAPVPGGVARAATQEDVIRLREINLIGVYGRPNARRALVRLGNGSYVRVEVGSALDGGQVTAIGDEALNYVKRGRTYAVEMPSG